MSLVAGQRSPVPPAHSHPHAPTRQYFVPYRGMRREICKTQFLHYFKISRFVVQSVAKTKAAAAMSNPLSPMKSPSKQAASNTTRSSPIKVKFEKFLQSLPQADNRFSDAARPHTAP